MSDGVWDKTETAEDLNLKLDAAANDRLTMLDVFAAAAMAGLLSRDDSPRDYWDLVEKAYEEADVLRTCRIELLQSAALQAEEDEEEEKHRLEKLTSKLAKEAATREKQRIVRARRAAEKKAAKP